MIKVYRHVNSRVGPYYCFGADLFFQLCWRPCLDSSSSTMRQTASNIGANNLGSYI